MTDTEIDQLASGDGVDPVKAYAFARMRSDVGWHGSWDTPGAATTRSRAKGVFPVIVLAAFFWPMLILREVIRPPSMPMLQVMGWCVVFNIINAAYFGVLFFLVVKAMGWD